METYCEIYFNNYRFPRTNSLSMAFSGSWSLFTPISGVSSQIDIVYNPKEVLFTIKMLEIVVGFNTDAANRSSSINSSRLLGYME